MTLLQIAFLLFALVATFGFLMFMLIAFRVRLPKFLRIGHGIAGFSALCFLLFALASAPNAPVHAWWALGLFAAGLLGGVLLFRLIFPQKSPLVMIAGHGLIGLAGLYLLWGTL